MFTSNLETNYSAGLESNPGLYRKFVHVQRTLRTLLRQRTRYPILCVVVTYRKSPPRFPIYSAIEHRSDSNNLQLSWSFMDTEPFSSNGALELYLLTGTIAFWNCRCLEFSFFINSFHEIVPQLVIFVLKLCQLCFSGDPPIVFQ